MTDIESYTGSGDKNYAYINPDLSRYLVFIIILMHTMQFSIFFKKETPTHFTVR